MDELTNGQLKTLEYLLCEAIRDDIKTYWLWMQSNEPKKQMFIDAIKTSQQGHADLLKIISSHIT